MSKRRNSKRRKSKSRGASKVWYVIAIGIVIIIITDQKNPEVLEGYIKGMKTKILVPGIEQEEIVKDRGLYKEVTLEDVEKNYQQLAGEKVRVSAQIVKITEGKVRYSDRKGGVTASVEGLEEDSSYPGTYMEVCGVVPIKEVFGEIELQNAWVSKKGEAAKSIYEHKQIAVGIQREEEELERRERLKESMSVYNYTEYVNNPEKYTENVIRVGGEVTELREYEGMTYYFVSQKEGTYFKGLSSEETVVVDLREEKEEEIKKGDWISVVGIFTGVSSYDRVYLQRQEKLPMMRLEFIEQR